METNEEGDCLLKIGEDEVEDQEEVLTVARISAIVCSPEKHAVDNAVDQTNST